MTINEQIDQIYDAIELLDDTASDYWEKCDELVAICRNLGTENDDRMARAKAKLYNFSEDLQQSGLTNADETDWVIKRNREHDYGSKLLVMCEYWELAADSAQCLES